MSLCYALNFELRKRKPYTEGIELQGCIVIWLGRWNTHTWSVHSNEMRHLEKGKTLGNVKCYEFSGWGNRWVKKSNLFQLWYWKPIYTHVLDAFSYIISFKEIKVGFEQEDLGHKRRNGKRKSVWGWDGRSMGRLAGAKRSLEIRGVKVNLGVHTEFKYSQPLPCSQMVVLLRPAPAHQLCCLKTLFKNVIERVPFPLGLTQHITSNYHIKAPSNQNFDSLWIAVYSSGKLRIGLVSALK